MWRPPQRYALAGYLVFGAINFTLIAVLFARDVPVWMPVALGATALACVVAAVGVVTRTAVEASTTGVSVSGAFRTSRVPWDDVVGQRPRDGAMDNAYVIECRDRRRVNLPPTTPAGLVDGWRDDLGASGRRP